MQLSRDITFVARRAGLRGHALASEELYTRGPEMVNAAVRGLRNYLLECDTAPLLHLALIRGKAFETSWSLEALHEFAERLRRGGSGMSNDGRAICLRLRPERVVAVLGGPSAAWFNLASEWDQADFATWGTKPQ